MNISVYIFADKQTRGQSSHELAIMPASKG